MNQIFLPEYPYSYKLLLVNFFAAEHLQECEQEQLQKQQQLNKRQHQPQPTTTTNATNDEV